LQPPPQLLRFGRNASLKEEVRFRPLTTHVSISSLPGARRHVVRAYIGQRFSWTRRRFTSCFESQITRPKIVVTVQHTRTYCGASRRACTPPDESRARRGPDRGYERDRRRRCRRHLRMKERCLWLPTHNRMESNLRCL
jgi:hypothetical protein